MTAAWPVIGRIFAWLSAAFITTEITDVVRPKVDHAIGEDTYQPAPLGQKHPTKNKIEDRWASYLIIISISAIVFFTVKTLLFQAFKIK